MAKKRVTILVPVFNEARNIARLGRALAETRDANSQYEIDAILIDDGSQDSSAIEIEALRTRDASIGVVEMSRNFGKEAALSAGLDLLPSHVDAVIMMDADLQHPPSVIPLLLAEWEKGFEIVSARRAPSSDGAITKRFASFAFYRIMQAISDTEIAERSTDFRLLDRTVVDAFRSMTERNRMVRGLIDWMGFKKTTVEFEAAPRTEGEASYGTLKRIRLAMNAITSFSLFPLKVAGYAGVAFSGGSALVLVGMTLDRLVFRSLGFTNIAFIAVANTFMIGLVLICLGLIALYIGNIHVEVLNRPLYIVRKKELPRSTETQRLMKAIK